MSYYSPITQKRSTPSRTSATSLPRSRSPSASPTVNRKRNTTNSGYSDHHSTISSQSTKTYPKKGTTLADAHLSPEEQQHLEDVLARYDQFRQIEDARVKHIRQELINQQKIRIKNSEKSGEGRCDNCNVVFVPLFQPANTCFNCHGEFCRACIRKLPQDNSIMCKFCYFESMNKCKLGVWFTEQLKIARAAGRVRGVSGPEALRSSILRLQRESKATSLFQDAILSTRESQISKTDSLFPVSDKDTPETAPSQTPHRDPSPSIVDSGYAPPRTETWLQNTTNHPSNINPSLKVPPSPSVPPSERSRLSVPSQKGRYSPTMSDYGAPSESNSAFTNSKKGVHASYSDLRDGNFPSKHKNRLDSDAGSRSNLSVASAVSHGSTLSIYSEREASYTHGIPVTGDILMAVFYEDPNSTLRVAIKQARDIAAADRKHHTSNPYVKAYLLPDKTKASKRKTSHKKATCNPIFDEDFKYHIPKQDLGSRSLQISVWHHNSVGVNLFLGEVIIPLAFHLFDQTPLWYPLAERRQINLPPEMQIYRGEVLLALKLVPGSAGSNRCEIHVWIKSAKGLTTSTTGHISKKDDVNPYAKIYLLPDRNKNSKQKTKVIKKSNNPEWNQAIIYRDIIRNTINEIGIEVSIWDHDRFSSNDFLGGCRLNSGSLKESWMDAVQTEKSVWLAMIERPNSWVEGSVRLRANLS